MNDDVVKERSHDELRRDELMVIMKDRSLGREKKARRMEEVRQKYAAREVADDEQPGATLEKTGQQAPCQATEDTAEKHQSLVEQLRQELQSILRDKTLSRDKRKQKMEQARGKYATLAQEQDNGTTEISSTEKVSIDLSAKSYAEKRRASLEMLEISISSNG